MTYHLLVVQNNGTEVDRPILITVYPAPDEAPVIEYLAASPPQIRLGESVSIDWKVGGDVHTAVLFVDDVCAVMDPAPVQGNYVDTPPSVGERVYKLSVTGPAGDDVEQVRVNVQPQPTEEPVEPTPTPEPTRRRLQLPQAPEIWGFEVTPTNIEQGQSVTASWTTGGGTTYVQLLRNDQVIWEDAGFEQLRPRYATGGGRRDDPIRSGSVQQCRSIDPREAIVRVAEAPPQNLLANTTWQLKASGVEDIPGEVTVAAYFGADGGLSGSSGCNSYSASLCIERAGNYHQHTIWWRTGLRRAVRQPGTELSGAATQTANFEMNGNLILRGNTGQVILRFSRIG